MLLDASRCVYFLRLGVKVDFIAKLSRSPLYLWSNYVSYVSYLEAFALTYRPSLLTW